MATARRVFALLPRPPSARSSRSHPRGSRRGAGEGRCAARCGRAGPTRSAGSRRRRPKRGRSRRALRGGRARCARSRRPRKSTPRGSSPSAGSGAHEGWRPRGGGRPPAGGSHARPGCAPARRRRAWRPGAPAEGVRGRRAPDDVVAPPRCPAASRGCRARTARARRGGAPGRRAPAARMGPRAETEAGAAASPAATEAGSAAPTGAWATTCPATSPAAVTENAQAHAKERVSILLTRGDDIRE